MKKTLLLLSIMLGLTSCAEIPITAAQHEKDLALEKAIRAKYDAEPHALLSGVDILVFNGKANLTGVVFVWQDKDTAFSDAEAVVGKNNVSGSITISQFE